MPGNTPEGSDQPLPEWWRRLSPEDRAALQQIMGENWQPSGKPEEDIARVFAETQKRIREIEQRAMKKLRGDDDNSDP
jgi:DNA-directed RNA polymerase sigma subunit (sigma70/sigma32)